LWAGFISRNNFATIREREPTKSEVNVIELLHGTSRVHSDSSSSCSDTRAGCLTEKLTFKNFPTDFPCGKIN
jgi:hypothetical protein